MSERHHPLKDGREYQLTTIGMDDAKQDRWSATAKVRWNGTKWQIRALKTKRLEAALIGIPKLMEEWWD